MQLTVCPYEAISQLLGKLAGGKGREAKKENVDVGIDRDAQCSGPWEGADEVQMRSRTRRRLDVGEPWRVCASSALVARSRAVECPGGWTPAGESVRARAHAALNGAGAKSS